MLFKGRVMPPTLTKCIYFPFNQLLKEANQISLLQREKGDRVSGG